jgi:hypothetical protein
MSPAASIWTVPGGGVVEVLVGVVVVLVGVVVVLVGVVVVLVGVVVVSVGVVLEVVGLGDTGFSSLFTSAMIAFSSIFMFTLESVGTAELSELMAVIASRAFWRIALSVAMSDAVRDAEVPTAGVLGPDFAVAYASIETTMRIARIAPIV